MDMLGGCQKHKAVLVVAAGTPWTDSVEALNHARKVFGTAAIVSSRKVVTGWPQGPNEMFLTGALYVANTFNAPFLYCEPDCIPVRTRWLDRIEDDYGRAGKPYMGAFVESTQAGIPPVSLAGNAVYPASAFIDMEQIILSKPHAAFDVSTAGYIIPIAQPTQLIHHFWGQPNLAPTFAENRWPDSPINTFTLEKINPEAVLFHRNKDGTLIRLLKRTLFPEKNAVPFSVVFPICNKDGAIAVKLAEWLLRMGIRLETHGVVSSDSDTLSKYSSRMVEVIRHVFSSVDHFRYRAGSTRSWPDGANQAFRNTAHFMAKQGKPWLWTEADAVPVHRSWLDRLQAAYELAGMPFFGPIVPGMGHMNGVGVYPVNTPEIIPNSLWTAPHIAWDSQMKGEMIHLCHNAEPLIQHVWGIVNGQPHPIMGDAPVFDTVQKVKDWVHPQAALFHRAKDGSLIDRLAEMKQIK
jgi:hypothetical protein